MPRSYYVDHVGRKPRDSSASVLVGLKVYNTISDLKNYLMSLFMTREAREGMGSLGDGINYTML